MTTLQMAVVRQPSLPIAYGLWLWGETSSVACIKYVTFARGTVSKPNCLSPP